MRGGSDQGEEGRGSVETHGVACVNIYFNSI